MTMPTSQTGLIDVHTHLLPGVDDGCKTVADSLRCAMALVDAGYTHAFCTPHVWPLYPANEPRTIARRVRELQAAYDQASLPLTLLPGGELNLLNGWAALDGAALADVVSYGLTGRYALFDFWAADADELRKSLLPAVRYLQGLGLQLILAHPERIEVFHRTPAFLDELTATGVLLQMNTWCLTEPARSPIYRLAERLLKEGRYFLFGTDLHEPTGMKIRMDGLAIARRMVGEEAVVRLTCENPRLLLDAAAAL